MLRIQNRNWQLCLLCSISCWCLGCGAPATEKATEQVSSADSSPAPKAAEKPVEPAVEPAPSATQSPEQEPAESDVAAETTENTPAQEPILPVVTDSSQTVEETAETTSEEPRDPPLDPSEGEFVEPPKLPPPDGATAMPQPNRVWIDTEKKVVFVDGYISLQEGMLEMFACPIGTKEHESVVAVYSSAQIVHAALLAVGAKVGTPVNFDPEFKPPTGTEIAIEVRWQDEKGEWQSIEAQQLITDIKTDQPMTHSWVFAGSGFYKDEESGEEFYMAESGDFICVSNFSTATLDIPAESSQVNNGLLFEANATKVPPLWTPVRLVLKPKLEK